MKNLQMMIGLPRSGKSTYVKNRLQPINGWAVVSADQLRLLVYGERFNADKEPEMWAARDILLKSLMENGTDIVIDETNTTEARRGKIIQLAKVYGYQVDAIWIDTPSHICMIRANSTYPDLVQHIDRMVGQFESPSLSEGFDLITRISNYELSSEEHKTDSQASFYGVRL